MKWRRPQINDFCNKLYLLAENQLYELWTHRMGWRGVPKKNIFTHKQWFFVILENKDITKLPINLSLIYFWQLFGVNLLQSLNDNLWKKHVKLPRVMYLLEIKCLGTFCPQSVKEDKQFGPTTTWTARAQRAVHCQCSVHCCAGSRCTSFGVRLGPCS